MTTLALPAPAWHRPLLEFLPLVRSTASKSFRHLSGTEREDAIEDVVADSTAQFARLASRGRAHFWLVAPVARYAVRCRVAGRRLGTALNKHDVLSPVPRAGARVASLDSLAGSDPAAWRATVADSRRTDPAEAAAFRVDFEAWLGGLTDRSREVALALTEGDTTGELARKLGVSPGRVSQIRAELRSSWILFQGEAGAPASVPKRKPVVAERARPVRGGGRNRSASTARRGRRPVTELLVGADGKE